MTIEQTIQKAMEGGWKHPSYLEFEQYDEKREEVMFWGDGTQTDRISIYKILLDSLFWQALGKAMNWNGTTYFQMKHNIRDIFPDWKAYWILFILDLSDGKSPEQFFEKIN
jgi:hypothetical protein